MYTPWRPQRCLFVTVTPRLIPVFWLLSCAIRTVQHSSFAVSITVWLYKISVFVPEPKCFPVLRCKNFIIAKPENWSIDCTSIFDVRDLIITVLENRSANCPFIFFAVSPGIHQFCSLIIAVPMSTPVLRRPFFCSSQAKSC